MGRELRTTNRPILDAVGDVTIKNGSPAKIGDVHRLDRNQYALFYRFGTPPVWFTMGGNGGDAAQVTVEYPVPPGVEFVNIHLLAAGDGGFSNTTNNSWKLEGDVVITSDTDTNGSLLVVLVKPGHFGKTFTSLQDAVHVYTDGTYSDTETALKINRPLRVAANENATAWASETIRIAVPATVYLYGVGIEPIYRQID